MILTETQKKNRREYKNLVLNIFLFLFFLKLNQTAGIYNLSHYGLSETSHGSFYASIPYLSIVLKAIYVNFEII